MSEQAVKIISWCFLTANAAFAAGYIIGWFRCEKAFDINQFWVALDGTVSEIKTFPRALMPKEVLQLHRYNMLPKEKP